jgi:hypothetical protein
MTRQEAIQKVNSGERIEVVFTPEQHGVSQGFVVMIYQTSICDFPRQRQNHHESIGPIHCMFWSGGHPHWIHISAEQLLGFINRNFSQ